MSINVDRVGISFVVCEFLYKYKVVLFFRSIISFIIIIDDVDLVLYEKRLNEIK